MTCQALTNPNVERLARRMLYSKPFIPKGMSSEEAQAWRVEFEAIKAELRRLLNEPPLH